MKRKSQGKQELEELWEHAVARAREDKRADPELEREALNDTAGMKVQVGSRAGHSSYGNCTYPIAICP